MIGNQIVHVKLNNHECDKTGFPEVTTKIYGTLVEKHVDSTVSAWKGLTTVAHNEGEDFVDSP